MKKAILIFVLGVVLLISGITYFEKVKKAEQKEVVRERLDLLIEILNEKDAERFYNFFSSVSRAQLTLRDVEMFMSEQRRMNVHYELIDVYDIKIDKGIAVTTGLLRTSNNGIYLLDLRKTAEIQFVNTRFQEENSNFKITTNIQTQYGSAGTLSITVSGEEAETLKNLIEGFDPSLTTFEPIRFQGMVLKILFTNQIEMRVVVPPYDEGEPSFFVNVKRGEENLRVIEKNSNVSILYSRIIPFKEGFRYESGEWMYMERTVDPLPSLI
ncbi:MAG: hypothetical protein ACE5K0_08475 [Candidatus Methanofastidiosia archaeon]